MKWYICGAFFYEIQLIRHYKPMNYLDCKFYEEKSESYSTFYVGVSHWL